MSNALGCFGDMHGKCSKLDKNMLFQVDPLITIDYMILGYGAMWVIALVYVLHLSVQQRNIKRDIDLLNRLLDEEERDE